MKNTRKWQYGTLAFLLTLGFGAGGTRAALAQSGDTYAVGDETANPPRETASEARDQGEPAPASQQEQGPVRLARFSHIEGNVTWREDESGAWSEASVNLPVRQGAQIWVAEHGRAEIQFDDGSLLRLGSAALVTLQTLYSDNEGEFTEIKLNEGLASLRLKHDRAVYQIDTPYASVKATGPAKLRIGSGSAVEVAVQQGNATVEDSQGRADLHGGDYLYLADADAPFEIRNLPRADSWETWNAERDRALEAAADRPSQDYLPPNIALVAPDLDEYGTWRNDAEYGHVWCPRVSEAEWRPYYHGRWTWVEPFGWTWVSSEAWGWAPYHYGTWVSRSYGWAWCPGPAAQYWSPAVVHFCEAREQVAWCPLAPSEVRYPSVLAVGARFRNWSLFFSIGQAAVYYPTAENICVARPFNSYYVNHTHIRNVTNVTNITNVYNDNSVHYVENHNAVRNLNYVPVNARKANGATLASARAFNGNGAFSRIRSGEGQIFREGNAVTAPNASHAPVAGPGFIHPDRLSSAPTHTLTNAATPPAMIARRPVYRAPLPQAVQRSANALPEPGRSGTGRTTPNTAPNMGLNAGRTPGGFTRNPGHATPGGAANGRDETHILPVPFSAPHTGATPQPGRTTDRTSRRAPAADTPAVTGPSRPSPDSSTGRTPARDRFGVPGGAGRTTTPGTSGSSAADRARSARASLGQSAPTPGGTPRSGRDSYTNPSRNDGGARTSPSRPSYEPPTRPENPAGSGSRPRSDYPTRRDTPRTDAPRTETPTRRDIPRTENPTRRDTPRTEPARPYTPPTPRTEPTRPTPRTEPTRPYAPPTRTETPRPEPRPYTPPTRTESPRSEPTRPAPPRPEPPAHRDPPARTESPAPRPEPAHHDSGHTDSGKMPEPGKKK